MYYFDNSATTQPNEEVLATFSKVAMTYFANPSSAHQLGDSARRLLDQARQQISQLLRCESHEVYFTSCGTESNNWVFQGVLDALSQRHPDRHQIIISAIEHPSIMNQIPQLEKRGYIVEICPVNEQGILDLEALQQLIGEKTVLLSTMAVNNEVGSIQPLAEIAACLTNLTHITWHVDGVQSVTTQFDLLLHPRIDLISLSSHKFHATRGTGLLIKKERIPAFPLLWGGGQEEALRSGTENLAGIVAMAKALRMSVEQHVQAKPQLATYKQQIIATLIEKHWQVFSSEHDSEHIICAALPPIPGEVLVHAFEAHAVYISTTSACASRKHQTHATLHAMGIPANVSNSAIRISMSHATTKNDVAQLCKVIESVSQQFNK